MAEKDNETQRQGKVEIERKKKKETCQKIERKISRKKAER